MRKRKREKVIKNKRWGSKWTREEQRRKGDTPGPHGVHESQKQCQCGSMHSCECRLLSVIHVSTGTKSVIRSTEKHGIYSQKSGTFFSGSRCILYLRWRLPHFRHLLPVPRPHLRTLHHFHCRHHLHKPHRRLHTRHFLHPHINGCHKNFTLLYRVVQIITVSQNGGGIFHEIV